MELSNKFKYLVVNTGYTRRLIKDTEEIEDKIKIRLSSICLNNDQCDHCKGTILYIFEQIPGRRFSYKNDILSTKQERKYIKDKINTKHRKGVIVLKCNHIFQAFTIINVLIEQQYCTHFNTEFTSSIEVIDDVLIFNFNCES